MSSTYSVESVSTCEWRPYGSVRSIDAIESVDRLKRRRSFDWRRRRDLLDDLPVQKSNDGASTKIVHACFRVTLERKPDDCPKEISRSWTRCFLDFFCWNRSIKRWIRSTLLVDAVILSSRVDESIRVVWRRVISSAVQWTQRVTRSRSGDAIGSTHNQRQHSSDLFTGGRERATTTNGSAAALQRKEEERNEHLISFCMSVDDFQASSHRQYMLSVGNCRISNDGVLVSGSSVVALRVNSTGCTPRLHGVHCSFEPSSFSFVAHLILHRHLWSQASDAYRAIRTSFRQRKLITHVNEAINTAVEQRCLNVLFYFRVDRWQWFESLFSTQRTRTTHWSTCDRRTSLRSTWSNCQRSALLCVCVLRQLIFSSVIMSKSGTRHRSVPMNRSFKMWRTASTSPFDIWQKGACLVREQPKRFSLSFPFRLREIDWLEFCTGTVVDSFATHVQLYRKAKERMRLEHSTDIRACFFDVEAEYEQGICRDDVCMDKDKEKGSHFILKRDVFILESLLGDRIPSRYCGSVDLYSFTCQWIPLCSCPNDYSSSFVHPRRLSNSLVSVRKWWSI